MIYVEDPDFTLHLGDVLDVLPTLPAASVDCVVTSPPYWGLRDYGTDGQIGIEATPDEYVETLVAVFRQVRRALIDHGTVWLNLGDSYNAYNGGAGPSSHLSKRQSSERPQLASGYGLRYKGLKPKDLVGVPWRVAFALQADGWYLRADVIWAKPNPIPESVTDRPTKAHEYVFLLAKQERYWFDQDAVREPHTRTWSRQTVGAGYMEPWQGRNDGGKRQGNFQHPAGANVRSVWEIATQPYEEAHFATFPTELVRRCVLAGCPEGGTVLDPFLGSGTTALVARRLARSCVGIELSPDYARLAAKRLQQLSLLA